MATKNKLHPVMQELASLIKKQNWADKFEKATKNALKYKIAELKDIKSWDDYFNWMNDLLYWVPTENETGKMAYDNITKFYFLFDQEPVLGLQNKVVPHPKMPPLTPLSAWLVKYVKAMGEFMDTPESLTRVSQDSFDRSPRYNMQEYMIPRGGFKSFNQLFARRFKPGYRPIAAIGDPSVITSPADSTFAGQWEIRSNTGVMVKGLHWKIEELLEGSPYKDRFKNGMFMHAFLNTTDYHRQHAPVSGRIVESRVIEGTAYLEVKAVPIDGDTTGAHKLHATRDFDAPDSAGYQFMQTRGLIIIDSPIGLVAVLPMGMAHVSSVIVTAEEGVPVYKGEEISYFQFGGSDIVVLFEAACNVCFSAQPGDHHRVGRKIAQAYPAL